MYQARPSSRTRPSPRAFALRRCARAVALALASGAAGAGNVSYMVTPITVTNGTGAARSLNDAGEVGVWANSSSNSNYFPMVWRGSPLDATNACCVTTGGFLPLWIDNSGALRGEASPGFGLPNIGWRQDSGSNTSVSLGGSHIPTGRGPNGGWLATVNGVGAVVQGSSVTPLPLAAGSPQSWGYAAAGETVVGKVSIGGLGHAAAFSQGEASLLHNGPSVAYDVNTRGQWVGFIGSGAATQAVLGGPGGVTVLRSPSPGSATDFTAIALNENGQVLAGSGAVIQPTRPQALAPFLFGNGRATMLSDLVPAGTSVFNAADMNEDGQIVGFTSQGPSLLTPTGLLGWAGTGGGSFTDANQWDSGLGFAPNRFLDVQLGGPASQTVWLDRNAHMQSLSLGGGTGRTMLELQRGALLRSDVYLDIQANGTLTGDGIVQGGQIFNQGRIAAANLSVSGSGFGIDGTVFNLGVISGLPGEGATLRAGYVTNNQALNASGVALPGRFSVGAGQSLRVEGGVTNYGDIEVFGGSFSHRGADPLFTLGDASSGSFVPGRILARDATLRFESGLQLVNGGQLAFSGGVNDVFGSVEVMGVVPPDGREAQLIVSGRADVTFWGAVKNNGELRVSAGSTATFFGLVSGAGRFTGAGTRFMEGGFAPGNSPARVQVDGDLVMGAASPLLMELGGTTPGSGHDQLVVLGTLTLSGGPLEVVWWDGFSAAAGDSFDLLDWGALEGSFGSISLPALGDGLAWDTSGLYASGELRVAAVPEPGPAAMLLAGLLVIARLSRAARAR